MNDPYSILGVPRDATDDQIKEAYRALARKYHPDNYSGNPLSDLAQDKMKEINEAYDVIIAERKSGGYGGSNSGYNSYGGNGYGAGSTGGETDFADVRNLIMGGRLDDAQTLLDGVPVEKRNAEWYFLNGSVLHRRGWFDDAYTSFATAVRMDPQNSEYRSALDHISRQRTGRAYRTGNGGGGCTGCDICSSLICADCCCECMGGDLIPCC